MIGFDLDDDTADTVDQQRCSDQVGRHLMHAAVEEGPLQKRFRACRRAMQDFEPSGRVIKPWVRGRAIGCDSAHGGLAKG